MFGFDKPKFTTSLSQEYKKLFKETKFLVYGSAPLSKKLYKHEDANSYRCSKNWDYLVNGIGYKYMDVNISVSFSWSRLMKVQLVWVKIDGVLICFYQSLSNISDFDAMVEFTLSEFTNAKRTDDCFCELDEVFKYIESSKDSDEPSKKKKR